MEQMDFLYTIAETAAFALALSTDALAAGVTYGAAKIKIPFVSAAVVGLVGCAFFLLSLVAGAVSAPVLPAWLPRYLSCGLLAALGLAKLADAGSGAPLCDCNDNKVLSPAEATGLASALSLDSLAAGFGAGLSGLNPYAAGAMLFACTTAAVLFGARTGRKLGLKSPSQARYFGIVLVVLAAAKLF